MLSLIHRQHGRHERTASREMPAMPPPPDWAWPLLGWLEAKARGEQVNPEHETWMRSLQRRLDRWQREQNDGGDR